MRPLKSKTASIGPLVEEVLAESGYLSICREYAVMEKWPSLIDPRFAEVTSCDRVENGILYVKVSSAAWRQEAVYRKETILERIRKESGCHSIRDIVFC